MTDKPATRSVSVIVTAMNEVGNLEPTIASVRAAVEPRFSDYEIIIVDDGSSDGTSELADRLAAAHPRIVVHHNGSNRGLAASYRKGIELATKPYTSWVAGNNIVPERGLADLYDAVGDAEVVTTYIATDVRGAGRRVVSRSFTTLVNLLFGVRLRYYTGPCVYRTDRLQQLRTVSEGSMIVPEILLRMVKSGQTYLELPLQPKPRSSGTTKTFRLRNLVGVGRSLARLFWQIQVVGARTNQAPRPLVRSHS
jgi:dolichol-phosphate mannosyltransferase